ncbi:hypothetical protein CEUSTIGMA_g12901.t1 [Chlamydomonas eustigma]|uniref:Uncharacterized protein n=1 Tax=Chlamydomonas eustigma TaxID=1157962 RepID=A0A250XR04_9CHLO|nr:hypothetical protein CEUSTIGMA_g12901.t1 [Chlamydomonas eustigma]|eukprot:GAX85485.1 hypothetical protein CEUSTIGMA_g12901.t1 [Chlamydomonas eustigma]
MNKFRMLRTAAQVVDNGSPTQAANKSTVREPLLSICSHIMIIVMFLLLLTLMGYSPARKKIRSLSLNVSPLPTSRVPTVAHAPLIGDASVQRSISLQLQDSQGKCAYPGLGYETDELSMRGISSSDGDEESGLKLCSDNDAGKKFYRI